MSFIFTNFLWFLPLIAAPIIIHLIKKRDYKNINFSTLKFFSLIKSDVIKKNNIINIILLVIRTLIILAIVLILARPIYRTSDSYKLTSSPSLTLLVDNSVSNFYNLNNNFNNLVDKIKQEYDLDTFISISYLGQSKPLYSGNLFDLKNEIDFEISYTPFNLEKSINNIKKYDNNINSNNTLLIFSDFADIKTNNFLYAFMKTIDDTWDFILYKTENTNFNLSLGNVIISKSIIIPNEIITINANVINSSVNDITNKKLSLYLNDINVGSSNLNINKKSTSSIPFKTSIAELGNNKFRFVIEKDDFKNDNYCYFNINIPNAHDVSVVYGNQDDIYFLKNALESIDLKYENINVKYLSYQDYLSSDISNDDVLFLMGYKQLSTDILRKISYNNLKIIIVPVINDVNEKIDEFLSDVHLDNISLKSITGDSFTSIKIDKINDSYLNNLFNKNNSNEDRDIKIFKFNNIVESENTIVSLKNNNAFINKYIIDNNYIYLLSSGFNLNYSNFPIKGTFIPFLYYLINNTLEPYYTFNTLNDFHVKGYFNNTFIIHPENEEIISTTINAKHEKYFNKPNFYKLYNETKEINISLNVDESEFLNYYTTKEVQTYFPSFNIIDNLKDLSKHMRNILYGIEIRIYFIYLLIILVLLEMYISNIYLNEKKY